MLERFLTIKYKEHSNINELDTPDRVLLQNAIEATQSSYAPYSKFNVGAAVLMENGETVTASNQENAASPSGLCAERVAIFAAHSKYPNSAIKAIAIAATVNGVVTEEIVYPCGACLQVMNESENRAGKPIKIIVASGSKIEVFEGVRQLLPFSFSEY